MSVCCDVNGIVVVNEAVPNRRPEESEGEPATDKQQKREAVARRRRGARANREYFGIVAASSRQSEDSTFFRAALNSATNVFARSRSFASISASTWRRILMPVNSPCSALSVSN